jgi:CRP-like cAMP-binding protein
MSDPLARFGKEFRPGDVLFSEGDTGDVMFVIQSGAVRISRRVGTEDKLIAVLGPGEFVGEMAILNSRPRSATATMVEEGRCLLIDGPRFEEMVVGSAEISLRLIQKLARRLDSADQLIEILMHRDPKARVVLGLSRHAAEGEPVDDGVRLRVTVADLAIEIAVEPAVVTAVLDGLSRIRLASVSPDGQITVADVDSISDFLEFLDAPSGDA